MNRTIAFLFSFCIIASVSTGCGRADSMHPSVEQSSSQPPAQSKDPREDIYNKSIYIVNALAASINNNKPLTHDDSDQHNKLIQSMNVDMSQLDNQDDARKVYAYMGSLQVKYVEILRNSSNPNSPSTIGLVRQFNTQVDGISSITGRKLEKIDLQKFGGTQ